MKSQVLRVAILATVCALAMVRPSAGYCPARIEGATIIGTSTSGTSAIYGVSIDIPTLPQASEPLHGIHLYVHDLESDKIDWVYAHDVITEPSLHSNMASFAFGWRISHRFSVSIGDVAFSDTLVTACPQNWTLGTAASLAPLDAGPMWDSWSTQAHPVADYATFHPANVSKEVGVPDASGAIFDGRNRGECRVDVHIDARGVVTSAEIESSSGFRLYDARCVDAARKDTYRPATFGGVGVPGDLILSYAFKVIAQN